MDNETLLPIHRQFTDKEKLGLAIQREKELKVLLSNMERQNEQLHNKIVDLQKEVKEWEDADINEPMGRKNIKIVTGKTYRKLYRSYRSMTDNFWRVNDELRALKKKVEEEKF